MPLILKTEHEEGQRTAIWEITEDEKALFEMASLNQSDRTAFALITNPGRRLEWLAVRALLKQFYPSTPTITYHENGKPRLINHTDKISISHSGKMVAIALHAKHNPGIDIEILHQRIFKIANRFLGEEEKTALGLSPTVEQLTVVWGAKEVLFKVYEHGGISFKDDFRVSPFNMEKEGKLTGIIFKNGITTQVPMEYRTIDDFVLVETNYGI
jgi:4'-phosphopantetheinyl transferase